MDAKTKDFLWLVRPLIADALTVVAVIITALVMDGLHGAFFPSISPLIWIAAIIFVFGVRILYRLPQSVERPPESEK